jgi:hypothetical protein
LGALAIAVLLTISHPAAAGCKVYNPFCWFDEAFDYVWDNAKGVLNLTWNIITLDPKDAWEHFKAIAYNQICGPLTPLSLAASNGLEADFHECDSPPR